MTEIKNENNEEKKHGNNGKRFWGEKESAGMMKGVGNDRKSVEMMISGVTKGDTGVVKEKDTRMSK